MPPRGGPRFEPIREDGVGVSCHASVASEDGLLKARVQKLGAVSPECGQEGLLGGLNLFLGEPMVLSPARSWSTGWYKEESPSQSD